MQKNIVILFLIVCFFVPSRASAQVQIERQVIGSAGSETSTPSIKVSSTTGETAVQTTVLSGVIYTEGFQQPLKEDTIFILLSSGNASCIGRSNGFAEIDSISGCESPYTVNWSAGRSPADPNQVFGLAPGEYTVQVVSNDGCEGIFPFSIGLIENEACQLKFFSGISPNNDGMNDTWVIENVEAFPENEVRIFNRLGNTVFDETNYDNQSVVWKGNNLSGNELPSGTYFYIFETAGLVEKGWIELTR